MTSSRTRITCGKNRHRWLIAEAENGDAGAGCDVVDGISPVALPKRDCRGTNVAEKQNPRKDITAFHVAMTCWYCDPEAVRAITATAAEIPDDLKPVGLPLCRPADQSACNRGAPLYVVPAIVCALAGTSVSDTRFLAAFREFALVHGKVPLFRRARICQF